MLSVLPQVPILSLDESSRPRLNELGTLREAVGPLTELVLHSNKSSVHLHCTVPTWCHTSNTCLDLHDLHELRSRALVFIHDLLQSLRNHGVVASYNLAPSDSSLCYICALPPERSTAQTKATALDLLQNITTSKKNHVLLADLQYGPCLIIS